MKLPEFIFHYTVGPKLPLIADSGHLMPTGFGAAKSRREKPILWWSSNARWEPTATKVLNRDGRTFYRPTFDELNELCGTFRFRLSTRNLGGSPEVGFKLMAWNQLPLVARLDAADARQMVTAALELGAVPTDWWGCLEPVSLSFEASGRLQLEVWRNPNWEPVIGGTREGVLATRKNPLRFLQAKSSDVPQAQGL